MSRVNDGTPFISRGEKFLTATFKAWSYHVVKLSISGA
jgi:hypothetical protein